MTALSIGRARHKRTSFASCRRSIITKLFQPSDLPNHRTIMPLKKELQKQCKDAGIGVGGTINDLKDRLEAYQKYEEALLGDPEELCDAILVSRTTAGGSEEKVTKEAKYAFERTLEDPDEALEVTQIRGEFYVGNRRGVSLGERPSELGEKDISKDAKIASLDAKIALLDAKVASLEKRDDLLAEEMLLLKAESKDYRRVRSRFISTFVRDKLKNQTPIDEMIIHEGNCTAHRGDAAVDALLYDGAEGAKRDDEYAFEVLYGLYPSDVKKISK